VYLHVDITDTDTTITRFTNGTTVPDAIRDYLLCDATVQPVWVRDHIPIGIGRTSRVIPERTRRLVMHRDGGRCRVPGAGRVGSRSITSSTGTPTADRPRPGT